VRDIQHTPNALGRGEAKKMRENVDIHNISLMYPTQDMISSVYIHNISLRYPTQDMISSVYIPYIPYVYIPYVYMFF
jgi:hypothetical protein